MARYIDLRFAESRCRKCAKSFCCKDCRRKHERNVHAINPDCYVCVHGKIAISDTKVSSELLNHLKEHHMPLHCVRCGKVYHTLDDINDHDLHCPGTWLNPKVPTKTPLREVRNEGLDFNSPEIIGGGGDVAVTSTPITASECIIEVPDNITPVDCNRTEASADSNFNKNSKKVTFIMTPAALHVKKKKRNAENFLKSSLKNSIRLNDSLAYQSLSVLEKSTGFLSAKDNLSEELSASEFASGEESPIEKQRPKRLSRSMSDTLWMSAINNSMELDNVGDKPSFNNFAHHASLEDTHAGDGYPVQDAATSYDASPPETGVWASMTTMFKNVVRSFNNPPMPKAAASTLNASLKRNRSMTDVDKDVEERILKRHKLCDVKCRPPIRPNWKRFTPKVDKSIQTDYFEEN